MKYPKIIIAFVLLLIMIQSCVLEERIHFNEDLSGKYEMSFALESMEEDGEGGLSEDFKMSVDSITNEISNIEGVEIMSQEVTGDGFNLSMNFKDIEALNLINTKNDGQKGAGVFTYENNRLAFNMSTDLNVGDGLEKNSESQPKDEDRQWVKHRVVITFDRKIKRLKSDGFKKVDKKTLVFDSEKITNKENISFSIKYK